MTYWDILLAKVSRAQFFYYIDVVVLYNHSQITTAEDSSADIVHLLTLWYWLWWHGLKVIMTCISRSRDFALYFEDFEGRMPYKGYCFSVTKIDSETRTYIFLDPVILPHILKTISWTNVIQGSSKKWCKLLCIFYTIWYFLKPFAYRTWLIIYCFESDNIVVNLSY